MGSSKRWVIGGALAANLIWPVVVPAIRLIASSLYNLAWFMTTRLSPADCALLLVACGFIITALITGIRWVVSRRPAPPPTPLTPRQRLARRVTAASVVGNVLPHVSWPFVRWTARGLFNTYQTFASNMTPGRCAAILAVMFVVIVVLIGVLHRALQRPNPAASTPQAAL